MPTVSEIVASATRKARITGLGEVMDADTGAEALGEFNRMLHGWKLQGVDVEHADQELTDTFALAPEYEEGTVYLLAKRLEPNFAMPANFDADAFMRMLQANYTTISEVTFDTALTRVPSQGIRDI